MPKLYMLIGVPGSGKSTWANGQEWFNECAYISTDAWVEAHAALTGKTYSEVFEEYMPTAVDKMVDDVLLAKSFEKNIIWDQTSTTVASRRKKFKMLPEYYAIAVVFKTPEASELDRRLNSRPGKSIPKTVIDSMINGFEMPTEDEGFKEIWYAS